MALFLKNITFHGILLDALFEAGNQDWQEVSDLLTSGIAAGAVKPLKTTSFDKENIEDAFRFMAQGKHIGKVVIKVRNVRNTALNNDNDNNNNIMMMIIIIFVSYCIPCQFSTYKIMCSAGSCS